MTLGIRRRIVSHEYLVRLILLFTALIAIPLLLFEYVMYRRACEEVERQSRASYHDAAVSFRSYYQETAAEIGKIALLIRVERKLLEQTVFSHPWHMVEAVQQLQDYARMLPVASRMGLYFSDTDTIVTSEYTYTVRQYLDSWEGGTERMKGQFLRMLYSTYDWDLRTLSSHHDVPSERGRLILAKPLVTGYGLENNTLLFCEISGETLASRFTGMMNRGNIGLAVLEGARLLYSSGSFDRSLLAEEGFAAFVVDRDRSTPVYVSGGLGLSAFASHDPRTGSCFIVTVPEDAIEKRAGAFSATMQTTFLALALGVAAACVMAIYASYRPISSIVRAIRRTGGAAVEESELQTIEHTIRAIREENSIISEMVSEQRLLLMDYVLADLIRGVPAGNTDLIVRDPFLVGKHFLCIVIDALPPGNSEREKLAETIHGLLGITALTTDIPSERHAIIVCALDGEADASEVSRGIRSVLRAASEGDQLLGTGSVVPGLEQLRKSYLTALVDLESQRRLGRTASTAHGAASTPCADELLPRFLQCVQHGYQNDALASLQALAERLGAREDPAERRFLVYELLVSYVHTVQSMRIEPANGTDSELLQFEDTESLFRKLSRHVEWVCELVRHRRERADGRLKRELVAYVNEHFRHSATTLTKVADEFGISIYTCSRFFKDYTGIGFKEYVTSRRMDEAKRLLASTERNIYEIAADVGFAGSSYFVRCFKASYGLSPAKYRQRTAARQ